MFVRMNRLLDKLSKKEMKVTLRKWQTIQHNLQDIIVSASCKDGTDSWTPFPIGIGHHIFDLIQKTQGNFRGEHRKLFHCSFLLYTDQDRRKTGLNRRSINTILEKKKIHNFQYTPQNYLKSLLNSQFVISPEGNGIDCHRTYEALITGCVPILEDNPLVREKYKGLPVLYTKDYSELAEGVLKKKWIQMLDTEYDFSPLYISSYPPEIQAQIKENGNYWLKKTQVSVLPFYI
jgi:hypothetical protein